MAYLRLYLKEKKEGVRGERRKEKKKEKAWKGWGNRRYQHRDPRNTLRSESTVKPQASQAGYREHGM